MDRHEPRIALTRSELERRFLALCESAGLPLPEVNAVVEGWTVDALWCRERVVVELDGRDKPQLTRSDRARPQKGASASRSRLRRRPLQPGPRSPWSRRWSRRMWRAILSSAERWGRTRISLTST